MTAKFYGLVCLVTGIVIGFVAATPAVPGVIVVLLSLLAGIAAKRLSRAVEGPRT